MTEEKDFFYEASGLFLTENLTPIEFDDILSKGDILPVCSDYEGWDSDYLEQRIEEVACELRSAYKKGVGDKNVAELIHTFIESCKSLRDICMNFTKHYKAPFVNNLVLKDGTIIGNIYFSQGYNDWSVKVGGLEYVDWTDDVTISRGRMLGELIQDDVNLLNKYISEFGEVKPKKREIDFMGLIEEKE